MSRLQCVGLIVLAITCDQLSKGFFGEKNIPIVFKQHVSTSIIVITLLVLVLLSSKWIDRGKRGIGALLLLAGGLSNLIDIIIWGGVLDPFHIHNLQFNLADIIIIMGGGLIISSIYQTKE